MALNSFKLYIKYTFSVFNINVFNFFKNTLIYYH